MSLKGKRINFNSVMTANGVSKAFLYNNEEVKERIELLKKQEINKETNQRVKTNKTSKSKEQLSILRGNLYSKV